MLSTEAPSVNCVLGVHSVWAHVVSIAVVIEGCFFSPHKTSAAEGLNLLVVLHVHMVACRTLQLPVSSITWFTSSDSATSVQSSRPWFFSRTTVGVPKSRRGEIWQFLAIQYRLRHRLPNKQQPPDTSYKELLKQLTTQQHAILVDLGLFALLIIIYKSLLSFLFVCILVSRKRSCWPM